MTDYTELQKAAEYAAQDTIKFADESEEMRALQQFHEEVDPETVLALIAENESAHKHWQNESNNVQVLVAEVSRLKAENERLERNRDMWKGQVERQAEELTALREEVTEWKDTVKFNEGCWSEERGTMIDKLQESRMRIKELDLLFGRYILAMRAAVIEEEHGLGAEGAMMWIYNSLVGPGELPPENETLAQAYFDREIVAVDNGMQEVLAFHEGRRAALGQGEQS